MNVIDLINETCKTLKLSKEILAGKLRERGVKISVSSLYKWTRGLYKPGANTERVIRSELVLMIEQFQKTQEAMKKNETARAE